MTATPIKSRNVAFPASPPGPGSPAAALNLCPDRLGAANAARALRRSSPTSIR